MRYLRARPRVSYRMAGWLMDTMWKILETFLAYPDWLCETHIREVEDYLTSGETSEAREYLETLKNERDLCADCTGGME